MSLSKITSLLKTISKLLRPKSSLSKNILKSVKATGPKIVKTFVAKIQELNKLTPALTHKWTKIWGRMSFDDVVSLKNLKSKDYINFNFINDLTTICCRPRPLCLSKLVTYVCMLKVLSICNASFQVRRNVSDCVAQTLKV